MNAVPQVSLTLEMPGMATRLSNLVLAAVTPSPKAVVTKVPGRLLLISASTSNAEGLGRCTPEDKIGLVSWVELIRTDYISFTQSEGYGFRLRRPTQKESAVARL